MRRPGVAMQISTPGKRQLKTNKRINELLHWKHLQIWTSHNNHFTASDLTSLQVPDLRSFGCASIDAGALETGGSAIFSSDLLHLLSQFTGRCQHQTLSRKIRCFQFIIVELSQESNKETTEVVKWSALYGDTDANYFMIWGERYEASYLAYQQGFRRRSWALYTLGLKSHGN